MDLLFETKLAFYRLLGSGGWNALGLLGEGNALLPAAAVIALVLWVREARRGGLFFLASVLGCAMTVLALKAASGDFTWTVAGHMFRAKSFPSGHVAMATIFWGGLALLFRRRWRALLLVPIPVVAVAVLVMGWHHTLDVLAGGAIGVAFLVLFVSVRHIARKGERREMLRRFWNDVLVRHAAVDALDKERAASWPRPMPAPRRSPRSAS